MAHTRVSVMLVLGVLVFTTAPATAEAWIQDHPRKEGRGRPERPERPQARPADRRPERPQARPADRRPERPEPPSRPEARPDRPPRDLAPQGRPPVLDAPQRGQRPDRPVDRRRDDRPPPDVTRPPTRRDDPGGTALKNYPAQPRTREQARAWERQNSWRPQGAWGEHRDWRGHRASQWQAEHRSWADRGGYGGYFIPAPQFSLHFGPHRGFRLHSRPTIYRGYPRFRHNGYWFMLVDPWPEFWSETWYQSDDVYIDYSDGYYLHNRRHPGVALAISISF